MTDVAALSRSAREVLAVLLPARRATRPQLVQATELSKPTVSLAVAELEAAGIVEALSTVAGAVGRSPTLYGLGRRAGWVLGLDFGSTHVRAIAQTLDGTTLAEDEYNPNLRRPAPTRGLVGETARLVNRMLDKLAAEGRPLRAAGIAVGRRVAVQADGHTPELHPEVADLVGALDVEPGTPLLFENNVNCAALGELHFGAGRDVSDFVYLQLGVRIGAGIVSNGALRRGAHGGAGEVRYVPFPFTSDERPRRVALEHWLGAPSLMKRVRESWPTERERPPRSAEALFAEAQYPASPARHLVEQYAGDVANLITALIAVLDPQLIVLGGGVGQNEVLIAPALQAARRLAPYAAITTSDLGDDATVSGASVLALEHARSQFLGWRYASSVGQTPILHAGIPSSHNRS